MMKSTYTFVDFREAFTRREVKLSKTFAREPLEALFYRCLISFCLVGLAFVTAAVSLEGLNQASICTALLSVACLLYFGLATELNRWYHISAFSIASIAIWQVAASGSVLGLVMGSIIHAGMGLMILLSAKNLLNFGIFWAVYWFALALSVSIQ